MTIEKEYKEYLLKSKIKALEGLKNRKTSGDAEILDSMEDLDAQIQALTNMLEAV
jgi:hypothetical protein